MQVDLVPVLLRHFEKWDSFYRDEEPTVLEEVYLFGEKQVS